MLSKTLRGKFGLVVLLFAFSMGLFFVFRRNYGTKVQDSRPKIILQDSRPNIIFQDSRPNIIFILADDYGYHDIGYHGSRIRTPNLDLLAGQGVKLENYYVQPICTPTRSQLMSGRYEIHTGLQHSHILPSQPNGLPLNSPTLAQKLKEAGYSTHMVGKWHLGFYKPEYLPNNRGFDTFFGFLTGSGQHFTHVIFERLDLHDNLKPVFNETGHYSTHLFTEKAVNIVRSHDRSKGPFFLYLPYQAVHSPLEVPKRYMAPYHNIKDLKRRTMAGMVSCMDEGIGNLAAVLEETGLMDNTIIIFSTDNGGEVKKGGSNYPLRGSKGSLFEGGIRGVGFVHSPLLKNKGYINREFIHVSDWFPTLVGLAQGSLNGTLPLDGFDQWTTISEKNHSPRTELLHTIDPLAPIRGEKLYHDTFDTTVRAAIRVGDMKLITGTPGCDNWILPPEMASTSKIDCNIYKKLESYRKAQRKGNNPPKVGKNVWLFNITADPEERHDLSESMVGTVHELLNRLSYYSSTAAPVRYPLEDNRALPPKGGVWGPWM